MRYHYDSPDRAEIAGLLHDCAKCIPDEDRIPLCEEYGIMLNEFEYNVKMYVTGEIPAYSANGYLAYAYVLYKKMIDEEIKRGRKNTANAKSEYFGNVGDKINITGIFEAAGHYDTQFGTVVIYKITDENDNIFIWKTTSYPNVESGSKVTVRGTIKEHSEYNGTKQTVLTRCKITECVPA
jgi:hypothetical protein